MIIFSPGPSNISENVRNSLLKGDICHRGLEFQSLLFEARSLILKVLKSEEGFRSIILQGSGTLAIESVITSLDNLLVISNGIYGERAIEIAKIYSVPVKESMCDLVKPIDLKKIKSEIKKEKISSVYFVHHETTTGILNPLKEIAQLSKEYDKLFVVDGISSIGGEEIDLSWGIDVIIGSFNKCIRGVPGLSFVVANNRFVEKLKKRKRRIFYGDLLTHLEYEDVGQTPFTPSIPIFYGAREALRELLEEGLENRIKHFQKISKLLRDNIEEMGLRLLLQRRLYSNTMTSIFLPDGFSYESLYRALKERGYEIYHSLGRFKDTTFRLGTVGVINEKDILSFIKALRETVK